MTNLVLESNTPRIVTKEKSFNLFKKKSKNKEFKERSQFTYFLMYNKKWILAISILAIIAFILIYKANCLTFDEYWESLSTDSPAKIGPLGWLIGPDGMIDKIVGTTQLEKYKEYLTLEIVDGGGLKFGEYESSNMGDFLSQASAMFTGIAWGLALIFWLYSFMEMLVQSNGQIIYEKLIFKLAACVICSYVIFHAFTLAIEIANAGTSFMNKFFTEKMNDIASIETSSTTDVKRFLFDEVYNDKMIGPIPIGYLMMLGGIIPYVIELGLPCFISWISSALVQITCYSRAIEICILAMVSPIMFIDLGTTKDFSHSSTARAIKSFIALALQGVLILAALYICQFLIGAVLTKYPFVVTDTATVRPGLEVEREVWSFKNFITAGTQATIISVLRIGIIAKTSALAKQALGV